jgi:hypothetical protein
MGTNKNNQPIKFQLPRYKRGQLVQTADGEGVIVQVRLIEPTGYWYNINDKFYAQHEIK